MTERVRPLWLADQQPCASRHTQGQPAGFIAWMAWAEEMEETHTQTRCPECGLWAVWTPKS